MIALEQGMIVRIFRDVRGQIKDIEGLARLVSRVPNVQSDGDLELWRVQFVGQGLSSATAAPVERFVSVFESELI